VAVNVCAGEAMTESRRPLCSSLWDEMSSVSAASACRRVERCSLGSTEVEQQVGTATAVDRGGTSRRRSSRCTQ
jgi:hypothetical protein